MIRHSPDSIWDSQADLIAHGINASENWHWEGERFSSELEKAFPGSMSGLAKMMKSDPDMMGKVVISEAKSGKKIAHLGVREGWVYQPSKVSQALDSMIEFMKLEGISVVAMPFKASYNMRSEVEEKFSRSLDVHLEWCDDESVLM